MTADLLYRLLKVQKFRYSNEKQLQTNIAQVLRESGFPFVRECLVAGGTIDFMVGDIGLEVKIKGTCKAIAAQLDRYVLDRRIRELLLVSTSLKHRGVLDYIKPTEKPVKALILLGSVL